jgi:hypothetical protein
MIFDYYLDVGEYHILCGALKCYLRFHKRERLEEANLGIGHRILFESVARSGLMYCATPEYPQTGFTTWWKLTRKGAAIVQSWINTGHCKLNDNFQLFSLPPRSGCAGGITITVRGGNVRDIEGLPEGCLYRLKDYDNESSDIQCQCGWRGDKHDCVYDQSIDAHLCPNCERHDEMEIAWHERPT